MTWIDGARIVDPKPLPVGHRRPETGISGKVEPGALHIEGDRITGRASRAPPRAKVIDARGLYLVPAFVDAHVHLSVAGDPALVAREALRKGVAAVLDLGAPERLLPLEHPPLRTRFSGPLLTAPQGYPTQTWGKDGHGLAVSAPEEAVAAVQRLHAAGARFLKLAFDGRYPVLDPLVAKAAADAAHKLRMRVVAHALEADAVKRALEAGADILGHTPREPLPKPVLEMVKDKWVISTLHAFKVPPARLKALRYAGARVAYGTDLGNAGTKPGIDARELALLVAAGVDPLVAATRDAAELLGFKELGRLSVGSTASLLAVRSLQPQDLADPVWVMNCGKLVA